MVEKVESSKRGKGARLTARQLEVLNRLAEGEPAAPEEVKRIDLTLNSLLKRGLIETAAASRGEPAQYRVTAPGMILLESRGTTAGRPIEKSASIVAEDESVGDVEDPGHVKKVPGHEKKQRADRWLEVAGFLT
jgi:hypothetical protein